MRIHIISWNSREGTEFPKEHSLRPCQKLKPPLPPWGRMGSHLWTSLCVCFVLSLIRSAFSAPLCTWQKRLPRSAQAYTSLRPRCAQSLDAPLNPSSTLPLPHPILPSTPSFHLLSYSEGSKATGHKCGCEALTWWMGRPFSEKRGWTDTPKCINFSPSLFDFNSWFPSLFSCIQSDHLKPCISLSAAFQFSVLASQSSPLIWR